MPRCNPTLGRNPRLAAETPDRRFILAMKTFRAGRVRRSDGSLVATLRKKGWIDDRSDSFDVLAVLLLRQIAIVYERRTTDETITDFAAGG